LVGALLSEALEAVLQRLSKTSATAVSTAFLSACIAWLAAPVPRPPQPIRPTRRVSPLAAPEALPVESLERPVPRQPELRFSENHVGS